MDYDNYEEVVNSEQTYKHIAEVLETGKSVLIGWTDNEGTHFDILFSANTIGFGHFQGGVKADDLFVSIMRAGAFGFETNALDTHSGYYQEKLGSKVSGNTAVALSELINGVKKHFTK